MYEGEMLKVSILPPAAHRNFPTFHLHTFPLVLRANGGPCSLVATLPCKQRVAGAIPVASTNFNQTNKQSNKRVFPINHDCRSPICSRKRSGGLASSDGPVERQVKGRQPLSVPPHTVWGRPGKPSPVRFVGSNSCGSMLEDGRRSPSGWQMLNKGAGFAPRGVSTQTSTAKDQGQCRGTRLLQPRAPAQSSGKSRRLKRLESRRSSYIRRTGWDKRRVAFRCSKGTGPTGRARLTEG